MKCWYALVRRSVDDKRPIRQVRAALKYLMLMYTKTF